MFLYGKTSANAIAIMSFLAADPERRSGSAEIAAARGIPQPITAKLLSRLASTGLVEGQPGPGGGYKLAVCPGEIRLLDIASLFEPHSVPKPCPFGHERCGKSDPCPLHDRIAELQNEAQRFLEETHLSSFAKETLDCCRPICRKEKAEVALT